MRDKIVIYNANDFDFNLEKIITDLELNKFETALAWFSGEYELPGGNRHYDLDFLNEVCKKTNTKFYIVFGVDGSHFYSHVEKYSEIEIIYWPTFLLHFTYYWLFPYYSDYIDKIKINTNFEKLFVSFNNKPHYHRCLMIDKLSEYNLLDRGNVSWCQLSDDDWSRGYVFKHWKEELKKIDEFKTNNQFDDRTDFILNNKSFLFLVTESTTDCEFITEKTFKPILTEQPFLCVASKNQNKVLEKYGFKLYDEIFDYTFDGEDSLELRVDGVIKNLLRLNGKNLNLLYNSIYDKILYNKKIALDIIETDKFIPKTVKEIYINNDLKNNNEFVYKTYGFINNIFKKIL